MLPLILTVALLLATPSRLDAQTSARVAGLRDDVVQSAALGRSMKYRVLLPRNYDRTHRRYRALYLLHGLGGDYTDWSNRTDIARIAESLPLIVVMPDGENSWYTNAADRGPRFEDYVADDLIKDVESKYRVIRARYGRAIAGVSMGGYGALKIALTHPGSFAAAGSFSGAFTATDPAYDDSMTAYKEQLYRIFGPPGSDTRNTNDIALVAGEASASTAPAIYIDCGTRDLTYLDSNRRVVAILQKRGFAYEYHEVPGAHSWDYWNRRIQFFLPWLMRVFADTSR